MAVFTTDSMGTKSREAVNEVIYSAVVESTPLGKFLRVLMLWVMSIFSLTVEVTLRRNFGERYLPIPAVATSAAVYLLLAWTNRGPGGVTVFTALWSFFPAPGVLAWLFLVAFVGLGLFYRYQIFRRNWYTGVPWHSYASGDSWLAPYTYNLRARLPFMVPVSDATQRYIEPFAVALLGFMLLGLDGFLGTWLVLAGVCLTVKEQLKHGRIRSAYLTLVDMQIEGQATTQLLKKGWANLGEESNTRPADKVRHNGFTAYIPIPTRTPEQRQAATATLEGMFPREMQTARAGAPEGSAAPPNWQQAKAQQLNGAAEPPATSPGTGDN